MSKKNTEEEQIKEEEKAEKDSQQGQEQKEGSENQNKEAEGSQNQENAEEEEKDQEASKEEELEKKLEEMNDQYLRLFSEFDNFKKRTQKEKSDIIKKAGEDVIKDLLPVLDDFERAIESNKELEEGNEGLKEGFELIYNKLKKTLENKGLQEMEAHGEEFNTDRHEAMTRMPAPSEDMKGKVVEVAEKGYYLNDKVIRYAKVVVGE